MKQKMLYISIALISILMIWSCSELDTPLQSNQSLKVSGEEQAPSERTVKTPGKIVIANRGSGSISVIDTQTDRVIGTFDLPMGSAVPEPMYVVYSNQTGRVFVGDRANDRVAVFNSETFASEGTVNAGSGVFHMWADPQSRQLWINNDIDNSSSVIDPRSLSTLATVSTPADLVAMGGKPHDVILDPQGKFAYITVLGLSGTNDYVVQFDTHSFQEMGRAPVGKDPHLSLTRRNDFLYVPCQNSNVIYVLDRSSMVLIKTISAAGAHGAGMPQHGKVFYTTNLPAGGVSGLIAIDTRRNQVLGSSDTPYPVPHNIAFNLNSQKVYLTHSGASSDKVTVYTISNKNPLPEYSAEITVGLNPFGLSFAK